MFVVVAAQLFCLVPFLFARCGGAWAKEYHAATALCSERDAKKRKLLAILGCTVTPADARLYTNSSGVNKNETGVLNGNNTPIYLHPNPSVGKYGTTYFPCVQQALKTLSCRMYSAPFVCRSSCEQCAMGELMKK